MQQLPLPLVGKVNADYTFSGSSSSEAGGCCDADNSNGPTTLRGAAGDGVPTTGTLWRDRHLMEPYSYYTLGLCLNSYRRHAVCYSH